MLSEKEMLNYTGGSGITATLVTAIYNILKFCYTLGQNMGSTIRRAYENTSYSSD